MAFCLKPLMHPVRHQIEQTRREFLTTSANGIGMLALGSLLTQEGIITPATAASLEETDPLRPRAPHFPPRAKNCIFIFMEGAPSQMDLFDPKPKLNTVAGAP